MNCLQSYKGKHHQLGCLETYDGEKMMAKLCLNDLSSAELSLSAPRTDLFKTARDGT